MHTYNKWLLVLVVAAVFLASIQITTAKDKAETGGVSNGQHRVVVLHSYHDGFLWTDSISEGITTYQDINYLPVFHHRS